MEMNINDKGKKILKKYLLLLVLLVLLLIPGYFFCKTFLSNTTGAESDSEGKILKESEEQIDKEEVKEESPEKGEPYTELFPIIDEQQAYVIVPSDIDTSDPPTLVIYSHGSTANITEDINTNFMSNLRSYGIEFTVFNYIFAASNQHGENWGNQDSIQDTLNLKEWVNMNYPIQNKIYLIGFSMGGLPTMNFTTQYPKTISKIVLMAPTLHSSKWDQERADKVKDIDIKIWHGDVDVNIPYSNSVFFVNKMKTFGKDIELVKLNNIVHFALETGYTEDILKFFNEK